MSVSREMAPSPRCLRLESAVVGLCPAPKDESCRVSGLQNTLATCKPAVNKKRPLSWWLMGQLRPFMSRGIGDCPQRDGDCQLSQEERCSGNKRQRTQKHICKKGMEGGGHCTC